MDGILTSVVDSFGWLSVLLIEGHFCIPGMRSGSNFCNNCMGSPNII